MRIDILKRLYIGFALAILLVIAVGIISFDTFHRQTRQSELVKHTYQVINQLREVAAGLVNMETGRRGFRSTNNKMFLEPYYTGVRSMPILVNGLSVFVKDNAPQYRRAGALQEDISNLMAWWRILGEDASNYDRKKILELNTAEKQKMDIIQQDLTKMIEEENVLLSARENDNNQAIYNAELKLIIGIILTLGLVVALIAQILKEFRNRKKAEAGLQQNYNKLSEANELNTERNWLLSGLAGINDVLQNHANADNLAELILTSFVSYLDIKAGAIYLYNEAEKKLVLSATVALPPSAKKEYLLGEGYIGQAATGCDPIVINDIPEKYATIQNGTVSVEMVHAAYIPFTIGTTPEGVLEVLAFNKITERHIKLLKLVSNNVSSALRSLKERTKVIALLVQVQEQKSRLENQQEELRQTNEELTVQAEVLQASEEELRVQEEELRQINDELKQKNEAVEVTKEALGVKAKELEESSRYKSEFLANMSHELRTPLNSVLILAKLLADNKDTNLSEKQVTHAQIIYKSGSDLLQLINDILDLSKIEAGKVDLYIEDVSIKSIVSDMDQLFAVIADEKGIDFSVIIDASAPASFKTDKQKLEQVLKNLLSNAFKFTAVKGRIEMLIKQVSENDVDYISMTVKDNGIGIAGEKQQVIFEAFQQADGATNRKYGGTGLGLSITKELMRVLHGKILLQSKQGEGSTFTILLPLVAVQKKQPEHLPPGAIAVSEDMVYEQTKIPDDRKNINRHDKVMLVIDDDEDFGLLLRDFARSHQYKTIVALSGDEGLYCARHYKPAAIILDMGLPVYNGETLLKIFKNSPELKHIPVHIISGADEQVDISQAALAFLKKPVKRNDLEKAFSMISEYLQSAVKRVMILSENNVEDENFRKKVSEKNYDVVFDVAENVKEAHDKMEKSNYDCLIADIGTNISKGIVQLTELNNSLRLHHIPVIIYIDSDITTENELALKKLANVIVRKSAVSNNRLMDELELFLYKVQENEAMPQLKLNNSINDDAVLQNKNVLIVDDDMRNIFALSAALEQEHMNVLMANDGREALEVLKSNKQVDIVLMDIMMPEMDGYEAIKHIRNEMHLADLPVIALTAKAMAGDREKCIEAGASDYISKPIETQKLASLMRVWLS